MGKFQSRKCQVLVLKLLVGLHGMLCGMLSACCSGMLSTCCSGMFFMCCSGMLCWLVSSALHAQGLCNAEPEFPCPTVRAGARPWCPASTALDGQVREKVTVPAKAPGKIQNCFCAWRTWCFMFCLACLCLHKAWLYWDSWASTDTSIPQWRGASEETLQSCTSTDEVLKESVRLLQL